MTSYQRRKKEIEELKKAIHKLVMEPDKEETQAFIFRYKFAAQMEQVIWQGRPEF